MDNSPAPDTLRISVNAVIGDKFGPVLTQIYGGLENALANTIYLLLDEGLAGALSGAAVPMTDNHVRVTIQHHDGDRLLSTTQYTIPCPDGVSAGMALVHASLRETIKGMAKSKAEARGEEFVL